MPVQWNSSPLLSPYPHVLGFARLLPNRLLLCLPPTSTGPMVSKHISMLKLVTANLPSSVIVTGLSHGTFILG